jgi:hypothetical protein
MLQTHELPLLVAVNIVGNLLALCQLLQQGRQAFAKVLDLPPSFTGVRTERFDWS